MTRRRLQFSFVCLLFTVALIGLPSASASAAGAKVLLVTRGEEGEGPPAAQGEQARVTNQVFWPALKAICGGAEEAATVGKNPSATVKVTGSDATFSGGCYLEAGFETTPGSIAVKGVSVAKTGAVKWAGKLEVTVGECSYSATKLSGTQGFAPEQQWSEFLTGTAKRVAPSAKTCAKTTPVEDLIGVGDEAGYDYAVELVS